MSKRVLVPLAAGCEEMEAVIAIDVLRRAGVEVVAAGLEAGPLTASRGVVLTPDRPLAEVADEDFDAVVLPGGGPGSQALAADARVGALVRRHAAAGKLVAAICAAPGVVLAPLGILEGRRATGYPSLQEKVPGWVDEPVVRDGTLITSQGPGTAFAFALAVVEALAGAAKADEVAAAALVPRGGSPASKKI